MKRKAVIVAAVLAATLGTVALWRPVARERPAPAPPERLVSAEGKVEIRPGFEVEVGSELEGKIAEFPVKEGDWVKRGQVIAVIHNRDIQARLMEAKAELAVAKARLRETSSGSRREEIRRAAAALEAAQSDRRFAQATLERYARLFQRGAISRQVLDDKDNQLKQAGARVRQAAEEKLLLEKGPKPETIKLQEELLARAAAAVDYQQKVLYKTRISAPISGKIIRKYQEAGECATKKQALAAIADPGQIRVNAEVDESDIGALKIGDPVEVSADAFPGKVFQGEVEEIADYAGLRKVRPNDPARNLDIKVVQVKVKFREPTTLKSGMTMEVKIRPH